MEGILFYWIAWMGWVWATFLMGKNNSSRLKIAAALMLLIISSPYQIAVFGVVVHAPAFVLILFFIIETATMNKRMFVSVFLSSFILMLGYVSFLLFELYDPVWVVFDRRWMLSLSAIAICALISKNQRLMRAAMVSGMIQGEVLFSFLMKNLSFSYPVASSPFLDTLALTLMLITIWTGTSHFADVMGNYLNHGRGRQKSS